MVEKYNLSIFIRHPRSSILVSIESPLCDFSLVINFNFSRHQAPTPISNQYQ